MATKLVPGHNPSGYSPSTYESSSSQYYDRNGRWIGPRDSSGQFRGAPSDGVNRPATVRWFGEEIMAKATGLAMAAVKAIAEAAAAYAQAHHPWNNRTGFTEGSVFVGEPELTIADVVRCAWGAAGAAVYLEYGTIKMPAYPWLRPAQDATYPHLAAELRL